MTSMFDDLMDDINKDSIPKSDIKELERTPPTTFRSFITGSQLYGTATEDSDIDLVLYMPEEDDYLNLLNNYADKEEKQKGQVINSVKYGKLNLLVCTTEEQYLSWYYGTQDIVAHIMEHGPITRDQAVAHFTLLRYKLGADYSYGV